MKAFLDDKNLIIQVYRKNSSLSGGLAWCIVLGDTPTHSFRGVVQTNIYVTKKQDFYWFSLTPPPPAPWDYWFFNMNYKKS